MLDNLVMALHLELNRQTYIHSDGMIPQEQFLSVYSRFLLSVTDVARASMTSQHAFHLQSHTQGKNAKIDQISFASAVVILCHENLVFRKYDAERLYA